MNVSKMLMFSFHTRGPSAHACADVCASRHYAQIGLRDCVEHCCHYPVDGMERQETRDDSRAQRVVAIVIDRKREDSVMPIPGYGPCGLSSVRHPDIDFGAQDGY